MRITLKILKITFREESLALREQSILCKRKVPKKEGVMRIVNVFIACMFVLAGCGGLEEIASDEFGQTKLASTSTDKDKQEKKQKKECFHQCKKECRHSCNNKCQDQCPKGMDGKQCRKQCHMACKKDCFEGCRVQCGIPDPPTKIKTVVIHDGAYTMGSPTTEACRGSNEALLEVVLTRNYRIATTEVTQEVFEYYMGYNPSKNQACGEDCPVENVGWMAAVAFTNALSEYEGLEECYENIGSGTECVSLTNCKNSERCISNVCSLFIVAKGFDGTTKPDGTNPNIYDCEGYRLPTEAEWEYAYRAETTTPFYNGGITSCNGVDLNADSIAWYAQNSANTIHPVAQLNPNNWGIYDIAGNVEEWLHDLALPRTSVYPNPPIYDPWGATFSPLVFIAGGSYADAPNKLRAARRAYNFPNSPTGARGFRYARTK